MGFKVGDFVKLKPKTRQIIPGDALLPADKIFKVTKSNNKDQHWIRLDWPDWDFASEAFDLVDPNTLSDLERVIYGINK
jgi:hypothetical protein